MVNSDVRTHSAKNDRSGFKFNLNLVCKVCNPRTNLMLSVCVSSWLDVFTGSGFFFQE